MLDTGKIHVDQNMGNPATNFKDSHNDEELEKLAWELFNYSSAGLKSLREEHPAVIPEDLKPHEEFYRSLIETSTRFLVETGNWYKKE